MIKFELCYLIGDDKYLIPQLLPVNPVDHVWDYTNNLTFEFKYKFLPKSIFPKFIIRRNKDIHNNKLWRDGAVLLYNNTYALVKHSSVQNKITVRLGGENKKEFLTVIRKTVNDINADLINVDFDEMVPCNCHICNSKDSVPQYYDYSKLLDRINKRVYIVQCPISYESIFIETLLGEVGYEPPTEKEIQTKLTEIKNSLIESLKRSK